MFFLNQHSQQLEYCIKYDEEPTKLSITPQNLLCKPIILSIRVFIPKRENSSIT